MQTRPGHVGFFLWFDHFLSFPQDNSQELEPTQPEERPQNLDLDQ